MSEGLIAITGTDNVDRKADIVFVHGLGGHFWSTWHPQGSDKYTNFFPAWLGEDFPNYGVWSMSYDSSPVKFQGSEMPIIELADYMATELVDSNDLGERPLIFITHSMGGILVKQMLRNAQDYGDSYRKRLVQQAKGIVYIATPHSGASLASLLKFLGLITSVNTKELEASHPRLLELNRVHRSHETLSQIPIRVFGESRKTKGILVVDGATVDPGIAEVTPTILPNEDHISIAKPESKNATLYKATRTFIRRNLQAKQSLPNLQGTKKPLQSQSIEVKNTNSDRNINSKKKRLNNLPYGSASNFVGRETQLQELDELLNSNQQEVITAIAGMGGVGKTELALQYALQYKDKYPGGVCWLKAREADMGMQIIQLSGLQPPKEFDLIAKVQYCWRNWQNEDKLLIVLDDVASVKKDYYQANIAPYLPPPKEQFKVLLTSRQRPGTNIKTLDLEVLAPDSALELPIVLVGEERINAELEVAREICQWLGYLPLGLELVGRYLDLHPTLTLVKTLSRLEKQKLKAKALLDSEQADTTAQLGIAAAFDLTWMELSADAQMLGCYLSLFVAEPFDWTWVEAVYCQEEDETEREIKIEELEELRDLELLNLHLLQLNRDDENYQLHSLIAQYFRAKLEVTDQAAERKRAFCTPMIKIAKTIPETTTLEDISKVILAIPHLTNVATELINFVEDENLMWSFEGLVRFYAGQGIYQQAEQWSEISLQTCRSRLGEQHPDVATSLNNLAESYHLQGKYEEAEPLYVQALEMRKQLLGEQHPKVAMSLNSLALLYYSQGKYEEAESLYVKALEMRKQLLGEQHPKVAISLNNLALLYFSQGKYEEAEPLYRQALEMYKYKQLLGERHPEIATSLGNLAGLYFLQGKYEEAEPLYIQALEMEKQLLGERHPNVAASLGNLAGLYRSQGKYEEAEPLYIQALDMEKQLLGERHPNVAASLNNLAELYRSQGKYEEAEPLYRQALDMVKQLLGERHPNTATSLGNLAGLYRSQGKYEEAEPLYIQALEMKKQLLGEQHPDIATSLNNLAGLYRSQGKYEEAELLYRQALEIAENVLGENHPTTNTIRENLNYL